VHTHRGFTLIELIITLAILAILTTLSIPSFTDVIRNNRVTSEADRLMATIRLARSEAIKRNQTATICRSANGSTCGGTTNVYEQGWLLYNDVSDLTFAGNANYNASEDPLIRIGEAAATDITLRSNSIGNAWLSFKPTGRLAETGSAAVYAVCYDSVSTSSVPGRQITVDLNGRATLSTLAAGATCTP